ncbi:dihydropteroate synthase [Dermabacteraceae bacterium P7006]
MLKGPAGLPQQLSMPDETLVMGIVNVTPDSFSDGGRYNSAEAALAHAKQLAAKGASILDVGGESTRPGAQRVSVTQELDRVLPVVRQLAADNYVVSVDTMRAEVAAACVEAGALIVNDVSAGLADREMLKTVAGLRTRLGEPPVYVAMHWRGHSDIMDSLVDYGQSTVLSVREELAQRIGAALAAGIDPARLVLDPGFGFAKEVRHNWELLADLHKIAALGYPLLIGASRKRFLAALEVDRDDATAALTALVAARGVWAVRVHEAAASYAAVRVAAAMRQAQR